MKGVRRQYTDILLDRALRGDVASLLEHGMRWIGTALGPRAGGRRPRVGPALGTLLVTYRCDLRCAVCDLPARAAARRRRARSPLSCRSPATCRRASPKATAGLRRTW